MTGLVHSYSCRTSTLLQIRQAVKATRKATFVRSLCVVTFGLTPVVICVLERQCSDVLRANGIKTAQLVEWMNMTSRGIRRRFGSHCPSNGAGLERFPEGIKPHLLSFETTHKVDAAISHMLCSDAILFLEAFLVTCLSIPTLRPLFLPLAESKVVHVVSKMLDNLLGLDSLESTIPDIPRGDQCRDHIRTTNGCGDN